MLVFFLGIRIEFVIRIRDTRVNNFAIKNKV